MDKDSFAIELVAQRGLALVVDDDWTARRILKSHLVREGYEVVMAADGAEAIAQYDLHQPKIVFLDVMLPDMYGYEVARRIKQAAGERYVPIIFLSGLKEEEALAESVDAGGDDFLSKPVNYKILKSKVIAIERVRDLYEQVRVQHAELGGMHERMRYEEGIAERIFTEAVMASNVALPPVQCLLRPASTFSGDLLISAYTPSGGLSLLLGDFTGHGLSAAIGALPASEIFREMTGSGHGLYEVLAEINRRLHRLLPTGVFLAASAIHIEPDLRVAEVWNSGMPDVILRGRDGVRRLIGSQHPPLGLISDFLPGCTSELVEISVDDAWVLCSDGVTEAQNANKEMFGEERLQRILASVAPQSIYSAITDELRVFTGEARQRDDISLAVVPCIAGLFSAAATTGGGAAHRFIVGSDWSWSLQLSGVNFSCIDPIPLAIGQLAAVGVPAHHRQSIFVVLTELFSNALEHGLLGLSSEAKSSPEGFLAYYENRQRALHALTSGSILLSMRYGADQDGAGGVLTVRVEDTGEGFDQALVGSSIEHAGNSGRGVGLLKTMCKRVTYNDKGNCAEVEYAF